MREAASMGVAVTSLGSQQGDSSTLTTTLAAMMWNELLQALRLDHAVVGTSNEGNFAEYVLRWLDDRRLPTLLLQLSAVTPDEFHHYIQVCKSSYFTPFLLESF